MKKCLKAVKKAFGKDFKNQLNQQNCDYMAEIGNIIHNYLMKHNKKYKKSVEMRRILKKAETIDLDKLDNVLSNIEIEFTKAHFILGLSLGISLK